MQVKYIGIHDAVELDLPSGARAVVKKGEAVETTSEHAGALVNTTSDSWELVGGKKSTVKEDTDGAA